MSKAHQISVDLVNMVYTAITYLALAGAAWLFLRLIQACFWLPNHLKRQNDVQRMLQDKVESYERYLKECEEKEASGEDDETVECEKDGLTREERWKERRECLEMLKKELQRIRDGGDPYDLGFLLEEEEADKATKADEKEGEETEPVAQSKDMLQVQEKTDDEHEEHPNSKKDN